MLCVWQHICIFCSCFVILMLVQLNYGNGKMNIPSGMGTMQAHAGYWRHLTYAVSTQSAPAPWEEATLLISSEWCK